MEEAIRGMLPCRSLAHGKAGAEISIGKSLKSPLSVPLKATFALAPIGDGSSSYARQLVEASPCEARMHITKSIVLHIRQVVQSATAVADGDVS